MMLRCDDGICVYCLSTLLAVGLLLDRLAIRSIARTIFHVRKYPESTPINLKEEKSRQANEEK